MVIDGIVQEDTYLRRFASGNSETSLSSPLVGLKPNDVLSIEMKDVSTSTHGSRLNGCGSDY
jgi:hypothetical protein